MMIMIIKQIKTHVIKQYQFDRFYPVVLRDNQKQTFYDSNKDVRFI